MVEIILLIFFCWLFKGKIFYFYFYFFLWTKTKRFGDTTELKKSTEKSRRVSESHGQPSSHSRKNGTGRPKERHGATGNDSVERRRVGSPALSLDLSVGGDLLRRRRLLRSTWVSLLNLPSPTSPTIYPLRSPNCPSLSRIFTSSLWLHSRVLQSANASEIKKAYYKLSLK